MKKDPIEFLKDFPEEIREKALANYENDTSSVKHTLVSDKRTALIYAFSWDSSPERFKFWRNAYWELL